jgi:hypothetical protein
MKPEDAQRLPRVVASTAGARDAERGGRTAQRVTSIVVLHDSPENDAQTRRRAVRLLTGPNGSLPRGISCERMGLAAQRRPRAEHAARAT